MKSKIIPHENDILLGRGGNNNKHVGNEKFRSLARAVAKQYSISTKKEKSEISRNLVNQVRQLSVPGRFLKRVGVNQVWFDIGDDAAREKASQVLRDAVAELTNEIPLRTRANKIKRGKKPTLHKKSSLHQRQGPKSRRPPSPLNPAHKRRNRSIQLQSRLTHSNKQDQLHGVQSNTLQKLAAETVFRTRTSSTPLHNDITLSSYPSATTALNNTTYSNRWRPQSDTYSHTHSSAYNPAIQLVSPEDLGQWAGGQHHTLNYYSNSGWKSQSVHHGSSFWNDHSRTVCENSSHDNGATVGFEGNGASWDEINLTGFDPDDMSWTSCELSGTIM